MGRPRRRASIRRPAALRSSRIVGNCPVVTSERQQTVEVGGAPGIGAGAALLRAERAAEGFTATSDLVAPRPPSPSFAALDLGTNNCRLLIARPAHGGFRVIDAFSRIVRLGEGMAASGTLSEAAMERTIEALRVCGGKIDQRRVAAGRYVATEACRRAANCAEFLARVRAEIGIDIEIISTA